MMNWEEMILKEWIQELLKHNIGTIKQNEPLAKHTTWKIGGPADAFIEVADREGIMKAVQIFEQYQVPWKVIGKGSNLLVSDKGFRGAILSLGKGFNTIRFQTSTIQVGSGFSLIRLANLAAKQGLTGLEFAGGIPGTVGGAVYMNAGAHGSDMSHIFVEGEVLRTNGLVETWKAEDFQFRYRSSQLQETKAVLLFATLQLSIGNRKKIASDMARFKDRRRKTQPYQQPCSGSVFQNPKGDYAGRLIEELGLKGYRVGGAQISTIHANFIVNLGQAKAEDVLAIIEYVKEAVFKAYQIELVPEVELFGER